MNDFWRLRKATVVETMTGAVKVRIHQNDGTTGWIPSVANTVPVGTEGAVVRYSRADSMFIPTNLSTGGAPAAAAWGAITGTLSSQTDLQSALNLKANTSALAGVALSGAYADLSGKPTIPTTLTALDTTVTGSQLNAIKTKVDGIAAGAEVNVQSDWNAVSGDAHILNKPTLGSAASQNSTAFATAAQGAKADSAVQPAAIANFETTTQLNARDTANRNRANHTGTQAISTVTGLQTQLDSKAATSSLATVATSGDYDDLTDKPTIPTTLAALDTTVTGTQLNALKTKVDGIAAGAEVNVQSDWNAGSGDAHILNKPTIPAQFNPIAGTNVSLTGTYPNITFNASGGGGGGGAVDSVNGQTGIVVLDADDIDDASTTHKFATAAELSKLAGIEAGAQVNVTPTWSSVTGKPTEFPPVAHTHGVTDMTATGTRSASTYLRGDNTWATPTNTTYTEITEAEITTGTASTLRTITGRRIQFAINKARSDIYTQSQVDALIAAAQPIHFSGYQFQNNVHSTTALGVTLWVDSIPSGITVPAGTYRIHAMATIPVKRSVSSGNAFGYIRVGGVGGVVSGAGPSYMPNYAIPANTWFPWGTRIHGDEITVGGGTVTLEFGVGGLTTAGTTSMGGAAMYGTLTRIG